MPTTNALSAILGGSLDLIPHIEEAALFYITRAYVMQNRVRQFNDMQGFNPRKVSEYLRTRVAQELSEATDIPETSIYRTRRSTIQIKEVGDHYFVTDRRAQTDIEDIVADVSFSLAKAVGDKIEIDLFAEALASFSGGSLGSAVTPYTIDLALGTQYEFDKRRGQASGGTLHHVIHPFQAVQVMKDLIQFNGATAGVNLDFRNSAIRSWQVPGFGNLEIVQSSFLPRNVDWRIKIDGTAGTFRLTVKDLTTAAITVGLVGATVTNVKAALDALGIGTWTVTGASNLDIRATCSTLFVNSDQELTVAINPATPTLEGQKSAYDLVTGFTGLAGYDQAGVAYGLVIQEVTASCKSLVFYRDALALDIRQSPTGFYDTVNQGRTASYSLYAKYGVNEWMPHLGMFINTLAKSPLAVA